MKEQTEQLRTRLPKKLLKLIDFYVDYYGTDRSKAVRELLLEGLVRTSYIGLLERLAETLRNEHPDPMTSQRKCEKCGGENVLGIYHIDGNVRNLEAKNLIILCKDCQIGLRRFIQKYDPKERFVAWYYSK